MSPIRAITRASLLWLGLCSAAWAVEILPVDGTSNDCPPEQRAQPNSTIPVETSPVEFEPEASVAATSVESATSSEPTTSGGGSEASTPAVTRPSARWNALLPGMLR